MKRKGDGITRPADVPLADVRRKIKSYYALLKARKTDTLTDEEHYQFNLETNLYYSDLTEEEQEMCNEIKDSRIIDSPIHIAHIDDDY